MPADPQHPDIAALVERLRRRASRIRAIGFVNDESASDADLAADNLEALARPQHPDITALVSCGVHALCTLGAICDYPRCQCKEAPTAARKVVEAALRALARPVEDEEVRRVMDELRQIARFQGEDGCEEAASLLARLAREKASAEQERDRAWKALRFIYRNGLQVDPERPKWVTEIISDAFGPERGDGPGKPRDAEPERALAAAAGAEEPRSAVPGAPSPRWRQISPETEAGLKALDEATRLGPHRARKMPPTGEEEPR